MIMISDQVKQMVPVWKKFITDLGYSESQAELFAEGYKDQLSKLPLLGKMRALSYQDDACMKSGFQKAGIDENEAFERSK